MLSLVYSLKVSWRSSIPTVPGSSSYGSLVVRNGDASHIAATMAHSMSRSLLQSMGLVAYQSDYHAVYDMSKEFLLVREEEKYL
jgi:hypothetical protein